MEHLLRVEHVTKRFADHTALDDVSVSVPRGAVYGLLGPNGAGKTTLIRVVNRITAPDSGRIFLGDKEITTEDVRRIGYLPENRYYLFGRGGAREYARANGIDFLGEIPIVQSVMEGADGGAPAVLNDERVERYYREICSRIVENTLKSC